MTQRSDDDVIRYMSTRAFKRRAARCLKKYRARMVAGQDWTLAEIAEDLGLPLDVAIGGFEHAMAKAGMPLPERRKVH